jgi:hypothetical protein
LLRDTDDRVCKSIEELEKLEGGQANESHDRQSIVPFSGHSGVGLANEIRPWAAGLPLGMRIKL